MICPRSLFFSVEKINYHLNRLKKDYKEKKIFSSKNRIFVQKLKNLQLMIF